MTEKATQQKVLIAGYYGANNAGDEVILQGILQDFRRLNASMEFIVIAQNPEAVESLHGVRTVAWGDVQGMVDAAQGVDLIVVGGGGLLQDYWGVDESAFLTRRQAGISAYGAPIILAKLLGIHCMFYGIGVGPLKTRAGRDLTRRLISAADLASVRDARSMQLLQEIGCDPAEVHLTGDPALSAPEFESEYMQDVAQLPAPRIGVSLRYWQIDVDPPDWDSQVACALDKVVVELGGSVVLVPFHESGLELENDRQVCRQVRDQMQHADHVTVAPAELNPLQRFSLIGSFDLVLAMRLHAAVAAARAGVPVVGLGYDPKVQAFFDGIELGKYCLPLSGLEAGSVTDLLLDAYHAGDTIRTHLQKVRQRSASAAEMNRRMAQNLLMGERSAPSETERLVHDVALHQVLNLAQADLEAVATQQALEQLSSTLGYVGDPHASLAQRVLDSVEQTKDLLEHRARLEAKVRKEEQGRLAQLELAEQRLHEIETLNQRLDGEEASREELAQSLQQSQRAHWHAQQELDQIQGSRGFEILSFGWGILWRLRDPRQTMREFGQFLRRRRGGRVRRILRPVIRLAISWMPARWRHLRWVVQVHHQLLEDQSRVILYTRNDDLFPGYEPRRDPCGVKTDKVKVSLVTTVKNEASNAALWLSDLEKQKRLPDEVILLEGGSHDDTFKILEAFAAQTKMNLRLFTEPGTNIATRRNMGVKLARHDLIAMTDFGCAVDQNWLHSMLVPFADQPETQVVAGWYASSAETRIGRAAKDDLIPTLADIDPQSFLPACRSIAFRKDAWQAAGGFAEWLTKTGEDTLYDLQLKRKCRRWAFVPDAQVIWRSPESLRGIWNKLSSWTVGDGESGAFAPRYWAYTVQTMQGIIWSVLALMAAAVSFLIHPWVGAGCSALVILGILHLAFGFGRRDGRFLSNVLRVFGRMARMDGFLKGVRNRPAVIARQFAHVRGVTFMLSGVPIDDTGGGARGTQIALEAMRRGNLVVFVHKYPKQESVDLQIDFRSRNLLHFSAEEFDWKAFSYEHRLLLEKKPITVVLEFPFSEYLPIARDLKARGATVVYDLIDEWNTSLGGDWYSPQVEQAVIENSDVLSASAPSLVERLEKASGRQAIFLPNAVNLQIFDRSREYRCPKDLPNGDPRILYIGALWGEWFDWDLLKAVARAYPKAATVLIGDYHGQMPDVEAVAIFLGLKPQTELPAYLAHSDVAIIPWEISPITQATSPLKVFEYVTMGVPVVAPDLAPLKDIPYVFLSKDQQEFIDNIRRARAVKVDGHVVDDFAQQNSWAARLDALQSQIAFHRQRVTQDGSPSS